MDDEALLNRLTDLDGAWVSIATGLLVLLAFAVTVSERIQKLLGPLGKWMRGRHQRAVDQQVEIERNISTAKDRQIAALEAENKWWRKRVEQLREDLRKAHRKNE